MICVVWRKVLYARKEIRGALEVKVDAEVREALKNFENSVLMHL